MMTSHGLSDELIGNLLSSVSILKEHPEYLHHTKLKFYREYLESLGAKIPANPGWISQDSGDISYKLEPIMSDEEAEDIFPDTKSDLVPTSFSDMNLSPKLLLGVQASGFQKPWEIQHTVIRLCAMGRDVITKAHPRTGKTVAVLIAILQKLQPPIKQCQALILTPTREAAVQTSKTLLDLGGHMEITYHTCIGGTDLGHDKRKLEAGVQIVIGTPGRVFDMINRRSLKTDFIRTFVLDEADELSRRGFKDQIYKILNVLKGGIQSILLSATINSDLLELANKFMRDPVKILVEAEDDQNVKDSIKQFYVNVGKQEDKLGTLLRLCDTLSITRAVFFCNTRRKVYSLAAGLKTKGHTVSLLHRNMGKIDRERMRLEFRSGTNQFLIINDVLTRGIDLRQVPHVINYDLPENKEIYINRLGRNGPFDGKCIAINLVTDRDQHMLREIQEQFEIQELAEYDKFDVL